MSNTSLPPFLLPPQAGGADRPGAEPARQACILAEAATGGGDRAPPAPSDPGTDGAGESQGGGGGSWGWLCIHF